MKKYLSKKFVLIVGIVFAIVMSAQIVIAAETSPKVFKFGINTPLSGPAAPWGTYQTRGQYWRLKRLTLKGVSSSTGRDIRLSWLPMIINIRPPMLWVTPKGLYLKTG